ncbi:MAG: CehA/McbA family metallohydrolase [Nocardioidaceae bacterium]
MCEEHPAAATSGLDRRTFLRATGAAATGVVTTGAPLVFSPAAAGSSRTRTHSGHFTGVGTPDWHYIPVQVPHGVRAIEVSYDYENTPTPAGPSANVIDIGIFDPSGKELGDAAGFRGWSGGARRSFRISRGSATPGYIPGPMTPGRWHVILGPVGIVPPGIDWTVTVTLRFGRPGPRFEPSPAPRAVPDTGRRWYRGDLHLHTVHSDGSRSLPEMVEAAHSTGLDFFVSTEHNTSSASLSWGRHTRPDLLVVNGEEVTTRDGHWIAVGLPAGSWVDWRYRVTDDRLSRFTEQVRGLGGLAVVAHPSVPIPTTGWTFAGFGDMDAIEVWNGPWTLDDQGTLERWHAMLVAGDYLPAVGSSDSHRPDQPVGLPQTVVLADTLSSVAVVRGLRRGRAWVAESSRVGLSFSVTSSTSRATCGGTVTAEPGGSVRVRLRVSGVPGCVATVVGAEGPVAVAAADGDGRIHVDERIPAVVTPFVRVEVRRPEASAPMDPTTGSPGGSMVALTNPIFVDPR